MRLIRFALLVLVALISAACGSDAVVNSSRLPDTTVGSETPVGDADTVEEASSAGKPTTLRLGVSLTPQELDTFQRAIEALDEAHPEWEILLEPTPQQGVVEKINTQLAANSLPDVIRVPGLLVQQWIRQDAFLELTPYIEESSVSLEDFYPGPVEQFQWNKLLYGLPDTAAPDILFYNKDMFDAAGIAYPSDDWTFDAMRQAALLLTLDEDGRNATDPDFNPEAIERWGWNGGLTFFWQRHLVQPFGGDFCSNDDCTLMNFTAPETIAAAQWWADLTSIDHAALYDPYGGSQTGVPGDPFISGKAAMGYNGFFAVGQLNDAGNINYDISQPLLGQDGNRYTPLSTNGYVIAANTKHPDEAWKLVRALTEVEFLQDTWGKPGHSVPVVHAAAASVIDTGHPPANQQVIVDAMAYGEVFKPYTSAAFEANSRTAEFFTQMMKGELPVPEAMAQIETVANDVLATDRQQ